MEELKWLIKQLRIESEGSAEQDAVIILQCADVLDEELMRDSPRTRAMVCMMDGLKRWLAEDMANAMRRWMDSQP